jgi:hypothetical protein
MAKQIFLKVLIISITAVISSKSNNCFGQDSINRVSYFYGVESEIMCFINKGYHGSFWIGKNGVRTRLVIAKATYPDYLNPEGFTKLTSKFYEIETDYFFGKKRNNFRGLWYALGVGYTQQSIVSEVAKEKGRIDLIDLHTGVGYAISIYNGFYINPWIGIDLHLNAPKKLRVGNEIWKPRKIDPVLGAKIGYSF